MARRTTTPSSAPTPGSLRRRFRRTGPGDGTPVLPDVPPVVGDVPPVAPPPQSASAPARPSSRHASRDARALFLTDAAAAFALANEARHRTLEQVFGIKRSDANLLTAVIALMLANSVYERAIAVSPPRPPTIPNLVIGVGALRETIYGVAGPASRDTPLGGTLIALAILVGLTREPVAKSLRGMKVSSRRVNQTFRGRYGYLVPRRSRARS